MADIKDFCKNAGTEAGVCRGSGFPEERKLQQETAGIKTFEISLKIEKFSYGEKPVLKNIDLTLRPGDFICLCGPNGSGKSTLLNLLEKSANCTGEVHAKKAAGALKMPFPQKSANLTAGSAGGKFGKLALKMPEAQKTANPQTSASREMSEKLASFLPQKEFCAWDTSVKKLILSGRFIFSKGHYTKKDYQIVQKAAELLKITELLEKSVYEISDGEFQKARIARTLTQERPFLIFDEPCANLDFTVQQELLELFVQLSGGADSADKFAGGNRTGFSETDTGASTGSAAAEFTSQKKGIIISIHDLNAAARFCRNLKLLAPLSENNTEGGLIGGTPEEVLTGENLTKAFGKPLKTFIHPVFGCPQIY